jgi:hypothetical protein
MKRPRLRSASRRGKYLHLALAAASLWTVVAAAGCNDVGDNTGATTDSGGADSTTDAMGAGEDAAGEDAGQDSATLQEAGPDQSVAEGSSGDSSTMDQTAADSFVADNYVADNYVADSPLADNYVADTHVADTYVADTGADTFVEDASVADGNAPDAPMAEGGADAPNETTTTSDASDAGSDAGTDGGSCTPPAGLQNACNAYALTDASAFNNSSGGTCTGTELALYQVDGTGSCLGCGWVHGCLDDTVGDGPNECEDTGTTGSIMTGTTAECLATLKCGLGLPSNTCGPSVNPPAHGLALDAYCGAETTSACTSSGPIGTCAAQETAGFGSLTPSNIVNNFGKRLYASGMANALMTCLHGNCATECGL